MNRRDRRAAAKQGKGSGADPDAVFARAMQLHQAGKLAEAEPLYRSVLQRVPRQPDALNLLGLLTHQRGDSEAALPFIEQALAINGKNPAYHSNLAIALRALRRLSEAANSLARAIALGPEIPELYNNLGNVRRDQGDPKAAIDCFEGALALRPNYAEAYSNLGAALRDAGELGRAEECYRKALALLPAFPEALNNLGQLLTDLSRFDEAVRHLQLAIEKRPAYDQAHDNLGIALAALGRLSAAQASFARALQLNPGYSQAHSNALFFMNYDPSLDEAALRSAHEQWNERHARLPRASHAHVDRHPERVLRVGYVSPDLGQHPVGYFLEPVLRGHGPSVQAICFSDRVRSDAITERLAGHAHAFHRTAGLSDAELHDFVRAQRIDLLIDLAGHTAHNRLRMFARKAAPVQASWLGYFHTTGLAAIDYVIMDREHLPEGAERFMTEAVVRLEAGRLCYAPPSYAPDVVDPPCLSKGTLTFGSFNNRTKLTPAVIALWSELLKQCAGSRLLLKWRALDDADARAALLSAFGAHGVGSERIELRGHSPHAQMLAEYGDIDIALDPFPFGGGLTSCEALWMGVPVVTLPGTRPASRQTASFLTRIGCTELIAHDERAYLEIASSQRPERLRELRGTRRARMLASPLCDGERFTRSLERAYRAMWQRFCAGEPPVAIA